MQTITLQVVRSLEIILGHLSASIRSLGEEYARLYAQTPEMSQEERRQWESHLRTEKKTTGFFFKKGSLEPAFQSSNPAYLVYRDPEFPSETWRELAVFGRLAPSFKLAFDTFDYSWVYLATARETMMIYPYLPLADATNNYQPTGQVFYQAADFENRTFGWTEPYLDLVGAGMMVTVSYPIFLENNLLGVVSRDITLKQLAAQVLEPLSQNGEYLTGIIINRNGLALANSNTMAMKEINQANNQAKAAVVHYRTAQGLAGSNTQKPASSSPLYNMACERVLALVKDRPNDNFWCYTSPFNKVSYEVCASRIKNTGWLAIVIASKN